MVKRLHQRASNLPHDRDQPGCMWGMFRLLGFHQHMDGQRTISEWRQEEGGGRTASATGLKPSKLKKHEKSSFWDNELRRGEQNKYYVQEQVNPPVIRSSHTLSSKQYHRKVPTRSSNLTRIKSIHHLECNDYVVSEVDYAEKASNNLHQMHEYHDDVQNRETHEIQDGSGSDFQEVSEKESQEMEVSSLRFQTSEPANPNPNTTTAHQEGMILGEVEPPNEKVFNAPHVPLHMRKSDQDFGHALSSSVLNRSGSYPRAWIPKNGRRNNKLNSTYEHSEVTRRGSDMNENHGSNGNTSRSSRATERQGIDLGSSHNYKDAKDHRRSSSTENAKGSKFIALDGILDKIPLGQMSSHDSDNPSLAFSRNLWKSKSVRENMNAYEKKNAASNFSRSRSLSDSLDSYSNFLLHSSNKLDTKSELDVLKLEPKHGSLLSRRHRSVVYGRIHSLPEFLEDFSTKEDDDKAQDVVIRTMESKLTEPSLEEIDNICDAPIGEEKTEVEITREMPQRASDVSEESVTFLHNSHDGKLDMEVYSFDELKKVNSLSSLDEKMGEDSTISDVLEDQFQFHVLRDTSDFTTIDKSINEKFKQPYEFYELYNQVDDKDEADFKYVLSILMKTGFYDISQKQNSPLLPLSPMAFRELEGLPPEIEICTLDADIDLNHLLLFDLVNDILEEIYEPSTSFSQSLFPNFHARTLPTGSHCLKEVWSVISQLLMDSSSDLNVLIGQDFAKKEYSWTNQRFKEEDLEIKLEDMVLEGMLDELVLELLKFS